MQALRFGTGLLERESTVMKKDCESEGDRFFRMTSEAVTMPRACVRCSSALRVASSSLWPHSSWCRTSPGSLRLRRAQGLPQSSHGGSAVPRRLRDCSQVLSWRSQEAHLVARHVLSSGSGHGRSCRVEVAIPQCSLHGLMDSWLKRVRRSSLSLRRLQKGFKKASFHILSDFLLSL